jgi:hypothetical protein
VVADDGLQSFGFVGCFSPTNSRYGAAIPKTRFWSVARAHFDEIAPMPPVDSSCQPLLWSRKIANLQDRNRCF